jgi:hypothetical protein
MAVDKYFKGKDDQKILTRTLLHKKITAAEKSQDVILTRFLDSNSRRDRDALIKKREQLITYKTLLKDELFQSNV